MSEEQLIKTPGVFGENGNFLLERELGSGGMGGVYLGRDKMLDRPVAMKVMLREYGSDAAFVEKFKKEAQAAARLIHPNIAQIYSYGISDGMPYIAMELVAGGSLDGLMKTHGAAIDVPRVMKIIEQVAQALRCAADQGLVHGDVKPENVLLDANGNAKLVDFGLAAMQKNTDEIWGTPYYIAPEKVKKEPVDYRADMYSLGGTLYHALTGVAPFEGDDAAAVVRKRFEGAPKKPSEVRAGLSPQVDALVMRLLALDPQDRYPTFEALLDDLKKVMTTGLSSTQSVAAAAAQGAASGATKTAGRMATGTGGKKLVLKSKKKLKLNTSASSDESGDGDVAELDGDEAAPSVGRPGMSRFKTKLSNGDESDGGYDDEEGGVGGKVAMVIGGVILAIALVGGGLWYMTVANAQSNENARIAKLTGGYNNIEQNCKTLRNEIDAYEKQVGEIVDSAVKEITRQTAAIGKRMGEIYPEEFIAQLKPGKSANLLKAEALTNQVAAAAAAQSADTNAAPAAAAAPAPVATAGAAVPAVPKFRDPVGDEADPNSPEGEKYKAEKEAWQKEQAEKAAAAAAAPAPEAAASAETEQKADENQLDKPPFVDKFGELWNHVYDAMAAQITIGMELEKIRKQIDDCEALLRGEKTETGLQELDSQQSRLRDAYKTLKGSDAGSVITKIRDRVTNGCKKVMRDCDQTVKRIKERRTAKEKEEAEIKRRAEEEERLKKEREELREAEVATATSLYQSLCNDGAIRQLDWRGSTNKLLQAQVVMKTGEGRVQIDKAVQRIQMMASVQEILQRNLKGFTFKRRLPKDAKALPLTGCTVETVSDREIIAVNAKDPQKKPVKITWRKFYNDYHNNLVEALDTFVRKGHKNGEPKLTLRQRANGMIGIALTFKLICSDDENFLPMADQMAKEAVKALPDIKETVLEIFPELDLSDIEEAEKSSNL